jgi:F-type H+-transporting ATPase subunit epsilon
VENNPKNQLLLEILSPEGRIFKDTVDEIVLPTAEGEITVLPGHAPLFSKLAGGEMTVKRAGTDTFITITGGFLELRENQVNILADYAIRSDEIEAQKADEARKKAEQLVAEKQNTRDFALAEKDLKRLSLELKVADKVKKRRRPNQ